MHIGIRQFERQDHEDWLALWRDYLAFYKADLPESVGQETWERIIDPEGDIEAFKAGAEDGTMLGMVTWLYHGTTWSPHPRCYLHDLFTVPRARGQRVGRMLIEAVHEAASEHGCDQVYWPTQEFNYAGRMLYDKVADRTPFIKYAKKV